MPYLEKLKMKHGWATVATQKRAFPQNENARNRKETRTISRKRAKPQTIAQNRTQSQVSANRGWRVSQVGNGQLRELLFSDVQHCHTYYWNTVGGICHFDVALKYVILKKLWFCKYLQLL